MKISVRRKIDGKIFANDMSESNVEAILEIHFCTSYTQVVVQELDEDKKFYQSNIFLPIEYGIDVVDFICIKDEELGEWIS